MGIRLEGKPVVNHLREDMKKRIQGLEERGLNPTMAIIRVGQREDDLFYEKSILKNCDILGIKGVVKNLPIDVTEEKLIALIEECNKDKAIHGIMLFRPLPKEFNMDRIVNSINPNKDIDCMSPINLEKVFEGNSKGFAPCTPKAVVEMLKYNNIELSGANITVVGRSLVVGKPLSMLLLDENATVTLCHSRTKNMQGITANADIVVAAIGKAKFMGNEYFNENSIVIDVGVNDDGTGKMCGDVDYDAIFDKVKAITPAIGGVGAITTTILLSHVVKACEILNP